MLYTTSLFSIYFGDARRQVYPREYLAQHGNEQLAQQQPYADICKQLDVSLITFSQQVHSVDGHVAHIQDGIYPLPFLEQGDFLLTNQRIAIGVMTADCLPVVMYDPVTHSCGVVHAGWRGTIAGVVGQALMRMANAFGTKPDNLEVFFGPSARRCCYEVGNEFNDYLAGYPWRNKVLFEHQSKFFFDNALCNSLLLQDIGVQSTEKQFTYATCTMCSTVHCSYRRDKEKAGRQMTVVALR